MMVETASVGIYGLQLQNHLRNIFEANTQTTEVDDYRGLLNALIEMKYHAFGQKEEMAQDELSNLVRILTACISSIQQRKHNELITEIYTISLWQCNEELRQVVLDFLVHLSVVNSTTTQQTLQYLVHGLQLPFNLSKEYQDEGGDAWEPSDLIKNVHALIVSTLATLLELVPITGSLLTPILARGIPNKVTGKANQCTYLHGLFKIAQLRTAGSIKDQILISVVQHLVSLDVEILWQDISWSPDDEEEDGDEEDKKGESDQEADIFEIEGTTGDNLQLDPEKFENGHQELTDLKEGDLADERVSGRGGFEGQAQENQPSTSGRTEVDENADKLDCMMCLVFQHLEYSLKAGEYQRTWKALLDAFFLSILNTHRSKFTQYLMWYFLKHDSEGASNIFLGGLFSVLSDVRQPDINRSASAAYIASYLARSAFVPLNILTESIEKLAKWCSQYCENQIGKQAINGALVGHQGVSATPVPQSIIHQVFYAACQGLLYVLCYRVEQLMHSTESGQKYNADTMKQICKEIMPRILNSRLAPLKVCLPTVVTEFSRLSLRLGLLDSRTLPQMPETIRCQRPLEMFFPFDPYLLRNSSRYLALKNTFVKWKAGHSNANDGVDSESDSESEEENMEDDSGSESSGLHSDADEIPDSDNEESQLIEEFQDLTPRDGRVRPEDLGIQIQRKRHAESMNLATSQSTQGTNSPPAPMSWTPKLPDTFLKHHHSLLRPLDARD